MRAQPFDVRAQLLGLISEQPCCEFVSKRVPRGGKVPLQLIEHGRAYDLAGGRIDEAVAH